MNFVMILIFFLILALTYPAFAQEKTPETRREKAQEKIESLRMRSEEARDKVASKTAALKQRLEKFQDQNKAQAVERINENLDRVNQRQTDKMLRFLDRATTILKKLENRVTRGTPDIKDVEAAKTAIAEAKVVINEARVAVSEQAAKDYVISVSSEARVKTEVKRERDRLHKELKATREQVIKAKQAVVAAIRAAKSGMEEKEGTPSGRR